MSKNASLGDLHKFKWEYAGENGENIRFALNEERVMRLQQRKIKNMWWSYNIVNPKSMWQSSGKVNQKGKSSKL